MVNKESCCLEKKFKQSLSYFIKVYHQLLLITKSQYQYRTTALQQEIDVKYQSTIN